ncbi:ATP-binding cassette domain-containing protein [Fangia hongkongensis]|uniref:ATP-binding cassette domain-containing protein n=1 Tax=Fangia hongkongensis TaxID=270495 RepID=UPI00036C5DFF|nr:ATP-binding cassette domain-containing protein [Fangia hongkongensis]MBK2125961.1 ATP-binding cassette domain-containing protein [Fangia hongkongensis]
MITLDNVALQRGVKALFSEVNLSLFKGQKTALVGKNGTGKSSLLSLISGEMQSDYGEMKAVKGIDIVTVKQEVDDLESSILSYVVKGLKALDETKEKMQAALEREDYEQHALYHGDFEALGGYQVEARAAELLNGLGFQSDIIHQKVSVLSGGWRIRLNLAQALLQDADLLLLDEPTNHLDLDAVLWLERYLNQYAGAILLISHDRIFLDNVVKNVWHIEKNTITSYSGNYTSFEKQYFEKRELLEKSYQKQQAKIAHLESFVNRFKAKASKAKQAQSRVKMLEKMQRIEKLHDEATFQFSFAGHDRLPTGALISLEDAALGYDNAAPIINNASMMVLAEMRVGLLGKNGAGKSTLVKSLVGDLALLSGSVQKHPDLKVGYFAQHSLDSLDLEASALVHLMRLDEKITQEKARKFLGRFNFSNDMALNAVKHFSGGEKARLALALIVYEEPNFLLLDEPTNHLDISVREALALALQSFSGALILISHDRYLLESTVDEYWLVDNKKITSFDGDLSDYYQYMIASTRVANKKEKEDFIAAESASKAKKDERKDRAKKREALKPLTNEAKSLEKKIERLQEGETKLSIQLQSQELYQDKARLDEVLSNHAAIKKELEQLESRWFSLLQKIEDLS